MVSPPYCECAPAIVQQPSGFRRVSAHDSLTRRPALAIRAARKYAKTWPHLAMRDIVIGLRDANAASPRLRVLSSGMLSNSRRPTGTASVTNLRRTTDAGALPPVELSIVMPCLNEAETIGTCVEKAHEFLRAAGVDGEVIVADNGATDGSREIATKLGASSPSETGRGRTRPRSAWQ